MLDDVGYYNVAQDVCPKCGDRDDRLEEDGSLERSDRKADLFVICLSCDFCWHEPIEDEES